MMNMAFAPTAEVQKVSTDEEMTRLLQTVAAQKAQIDELNRREGSDRGVCAGLLALSA